MGENVMIYVSHLLRDEEMKELVEELQVGVESIEFSISENLDHLSEYIKTYRKRLQFIGTRELTLHGPFLDLNPVAYDSRVRRVTMERFIQCYEAAQELGAKKIVYHTCYHPGIYFLIGWAERMEEFFHEFLADRKDISIVLENVFDREWEPILEVKQRLPEPNFSLCLDIGHAHCMSPHPVEEWAQKLAGEITHLHVHDNHGERDEHLGLGKGTIPVREVLKNFQGREDCTYTIECNTKEDVRMSCRMLREIL